MRNVIKEILSYAFLLGCGGFCLFILICMALYGDITLYEPIKPILIIEIALCVGLVALGIERFRNFVKRFKK